MRASQRLTRLGALAGLAMAASCGGGGGSSEPAAPAPAATPAPAVAPPAATTRAGKVTVRARVASVSGHARLDLEVTGAAADAQQACERLVVAARLTRDRDHQRAARPCATGPLPPFVAAAGVWAREITPLPEMDPHTLEPWRVRGRQDRAIWFPHDARCQELLAELVAARARSAEASDAAARAFLEDQLRNQGEEVARACAPPDPPTCAPRDAACAVPHDEAARACARARSLEQIVRSRLQALGPADAALHDARCVPAHELD